MQKFLSAILSTGVFFIISFSIFAQEESRLALQFQSANLPTEFTLLPNYKWTCSDGSYVIFQKKEAALQAVSSEGALVLTGLEGVSSAQTLSARYHDYVKVNPLTQDLIIERTLKDNSFSQGLSTSLSDNTRKTGEYILCPKNLASPIVSAGLNLLVTRFNGQNVNLLISDLDVKQYSDQLRNHPDQDAFTGALQRALLHVLDENDQNPLRVFLKENNVTLLEPLLDYLNQAQAELALYPVEEHIAPYGERTEDAWIFTLYLPKYSDTQFFVIVDIHTNSVTSYAYN